MSTTPATVQWPAGTVCSECGDPEPTDEVNAEPVCGTCYDQLNAAADHDALDRIAELLGQPDWDGGDSGDLLMEVRQIVAATGRTVGA